MTSEAQIEKSFIDILTLRKNQWTYRGDIKTEAALWENLRGHINRINLANPDTIERTTIFDELVADIAKQPLEAKPG